MRVWLDEAELKPGDSLLQKLAAGIGQCRYVGFVISPESVKSKWARKELGMALSEEVVRGKVKVIALIYRNAKLPRVLKDKISLDFTDQRSYFLNFQRLIRVMDPIKRAMKRVTPVPDWRTVSTDLGEELSIMPCPKCGLYFGASYGKLEFFEGTLSTCPGCDSVYVYGFGGLQPQQCLEGERPADFLWTRDRCRQHLKHVSNHYGYYGYKFWFLERKQIVYALRDLNRAIALDPVDERHGKGIRHILEPQTLLPEWIRAAHPEYADMTDSLRQRQIEALIQTAGQYLRQADRWHRHQAINEFLEALGLEIEYPMLYKAMRAAFLDLLGSIAELLAHEPSFEEIQAGLEPLC